MTELAIPSALGFQSICYDTFHLDNVLLDHDSVQKQHLVGMLSPGYQNHLNYLKEFRELTAQLYFQPYRDKLH